MTAVTATGFTGRRTAEIVGISYRQLDYWARTDLVRPSLSAQPQHTGRTVPGMDPAVPGSGYRRQYSVGDLLALATVKALLDASVKLERVRQAFAEFPDGWAQGDRVLVVGPTWVEFVEPVDVADLVRTVDGSVTLLAVASVRRVLRERLKNLGEM